MLILLAPCESAKTLTHKDSGRLSFHQLIAVPFGTQDPKEVVEGKGRLTFTTSARISLLSINAIASPNTRGWRSSVSVVPERGRELDIRVISTTHSMTWNFG